MCTMRCWDRVIEEGNGRGWFALLSVSEEERSMRSRERKGEDTGAPNGLDSLFMTRSRVWYLRSIIHDP
jgi:hypothetical protein